MAEIQGKSSSISTKNFANARDILNMIVTNPLQFTIPVSLEDFQKKFLEKYGLQGTKENDGDDDEESDNDPNESKKYENELERLFTRLQKSITRRTEKHLQFNNGIQYHTESEALFSSKFADLVNLIRRKHMNVEEDFELRSQVFYYNFSDSNIQSDNIWCSQIRQYCPQEAHNAIHPQYFTTAIADTISEMKQSPAASDAIRDSLHIRRTQLHMTHEASLLFSYSQGYKKMRRFDQGSFDTEDPTQGMRPTWNIIQKNADYPVMISIQVAGPFINISSSVLLPWPIALNVIGSFQVSDTRITSLLQTVNTRILPIVLTFYYLQRKVDSKEDGNIKDVKQFYEEWDSEVGEDEMEGQKTRELLCEWATGSVDPLKSEDKTKEKSKSLNPRALIHNILTFCTLSFGIPHREYGLSWLFREAESAYHSIQDASSEKRDQAIDNAQKKLAQVLMLHVLVTFGHQLSSEHAHVPFPNSFKAEDKAFFIDDNREILPRFYPFLQPSEKQKSFVQLDSSESGPLSVRNTRIGLEKTLGFLFKRMSSTIKLISNYEGIFEPTTNITTPMLLRTETISKHAQGSVMKLFRSLAREDEALVFKCHTNSSSLKDEYIALLEASIPTHETIVPRLYSEYRTNYSIVMEDVGEPLSRFSFGADLVKGILPQDYEKTFLHFLLPDAFKKLKELQSKIDVELLGDIKPGNLLKKEWEAQDLRFIDFEKEMTTWKYAAPEIIRGSCNVQSPIWGLALSLLSLVLDLDQKKLPHKVHDVEPGSGWSQYDALITAWKDKGLLCGPNDRYLNIDLIGTWKDGFSGDFKTDVKTLLQPCLAVKPEHRSYDALLKKYNENT